MLMRQPESIYTDYSAIKKKMDNSWTANQAIWQIFQTEATLNTRLEAGDTSMMAELNITGMNSNRNSYFFNRTRPIVASIEGHQIRNRKSTIMVPYERGDQATADQSTKLLLGIYKREHINQKISEAFRQGALISGLNLLHVYLDWTLDPINGDIKVDNLDYNCFFMDPYWRKKDLSDCGFVWRRSFLSHSAAAMLFKDNYEEIMDLPGNPTGLGRDGRFQFMPESYGMTQTNLLTYDEYYYRDYRKQKLFFDKETGETWEIPFVDRMDIDTYLDHYPQIIINEQTIPTVRLAIQVQGKMFYDGPQPLGLDVYPFVPVVGYYNAAMPYFYSRIQSVCTSLRDPQILYNRRVMLSVDAAESVTYTGWIFKENAVLDIKHLFQTGAGRVIPLKTDAQMTDLQQIQPPNIPPYVFQIAEGFSQELNFVSGVNDSMMGLNAEDEKSGWQTALHQSAGITTLQHLFSNLDDSTEILGDIVFKAVQMNWTPGKIQLILEGERPAPLFYNKAFGKYHATTELGFDTQTQKQMEFLQLIKLIDTGIQIPQSILIESATIQNKDKILQMMEQEKKQAQQMQQAQDQAAMQEQQARIQLAQARAIADKGLGAERYSRIQENQALAEERRAEALKDEDMALLNKVRALKELETIDINHLRELISLSTTLKTQDSVQHDIEDKRRQVVDASQTIEPINQGA